MGTQPTATMKLTGDGHMAGARYQQLFAAGASSPMPILICDPNQPDLPVVLVNEAFCRLSGYGEEEVLGRNPRFLQGPETDSVAIRTLREAITARRQVTVEMLNYRRSGEQFWIALSLAPIFDEAGTLRYFFASQLDVTRRREAEAAHRQAQRMEAIGQLSAGLAHDYNNLLTVIAGNLELIRRRPDDPQAILRHVGSAEAAVEKGARITRQLLAFARCQELEPQTALLGPLVRNWGQVAREMVGPEVEIELDLRADLWACRVDPIRLERAVLAVLANAADAMPSGGRLTIALENTPIAADDPVAAVLEPGRYVVLTVTDTGAGMAPEVLARACEPFFTTKRFGAGSGLSLAQVFGFAEQSRGHLNLTSAPGAGTTVCLYLPALTDPVPVAEHAPATALVPGGNERILVVEDDGEVLEIARAFLDDLGYRVRASSTAAAALQLLERGWSSIDLLFTDVVMPGGMDGRALADEVARRWPDIRILLTTGYAEGSPDLVGRRQFPLLAKPYRQAELARKLRAVLDA